MLNGTSVQKDYVNPAAPVHVCSGTAGALLCAYLTKEVPEWSAIRTLQFGYSKFQVRCIRRAGRGRPLYRSLLCVAIDG